MKFFKGLFTFFIVLLSSLNFLFAQQTKKIDSIPQHSDDSLKINLLNMFFVERSKSSNKVFNKNLSFFFYDYSQRPLLSLSNGTSGSYSKDLVFSLQELRNVHDITYPLNEIFIKSYNLIHTNIPVSNAFFSQGKNREQIFSFTHYQNLYKNISIGLQYKVLNTPGIYSNQKTNFSGFNFCFFNTDKDSIFTTYLSYNSNKYFVQENGGIENLNDFENSSDKNRQFIPVLLNSAQNRIKKKSFDIVQTAKLNKYKLYFTYSAQIQKYYKVFEDKKPSSSYYPDFFLQDSFTKDSMYVTGITNNVYISNFLPFKSSLKKLKFFTNLGYRYSKLRFLNFDESDKAILFSGSCSYKSDSLTLITFQANCNFGNIEKNNFLYSLGYEKFYIGKFIQKVNLKANFTNREPLSVMRNYYSNNYIWTNQFKQEKIIILSSELKTKFLSCIISMNDILNYSYFSSIVVPFQYDSHLLVGVAMLKFERENKNFDYSVDAGFQGTTNSTVIHLPSFVSSLKTGYRFNAFRNSLYVYTGIETIFFTRFYADIWSPVLMQYYLQNSMKIGNYVYPNIFISCKIKRARIFAMIENVTSGLFKYNYYAMPGYPRNDRFFRWGVSWNFIN